MNWKHCSLSLAASLVLSACVSTGPSKDEVAYGKVYISLPDKGGLVRAQENELIPYAKSQGFYCISPEDLELFLVEWEAAQKADKE